MRILQIIAPGLSPELTGDLDRVDAGRLPPCLLVAGAMDRAVMRAAERDGEFVARLAAERARLHVAQMVGIGWLAATDEARLLHDTAKVLRVAIATRCSNRDVPLEDEGQRGSTYQQWFEAPAELGYWSTKLESAIRELPVEQSEVLVMKIWGEMTFDEIATVLDISMNTVASRYRYALAKLRERMQPFEVQNEHAAK